MIVEWDTKFIVNTNKQVPFVQYINKWRRNQRKYGQKIKLKGKRSFRIFKRNPFSSAKSGKIQETYRNFKKSLFETNVLHVQRKKRIRVTNRRSRDFYTSR